MVIFHCFLYVYQRVSWFISTFGWLKPIKAHKTSQEIPLPLDSIQFHSIPIASPWNPIQFHWIPWNPMKSNEISWKSHEFLNFGWSHEKHPWNPIFRCAPGEVSPHVDGVSAYSATLHRTQGSRKLGLVVAEPKPPMRPLVLSQITKTHHYYGYLTNKCK